MFLLWAKVVALIILAAINGLNAYSDLAIEPVNRVRGITAIVTAGVLLVIAYFLPVWFPNGIPA